MMLWLKNTLIAGAAVLVAGPALAQSGSAANPIIVPFKPATGTVRLTGMLVQNVDCCTYRFTAKAGQLLDWRETGAATRQVITYPDGNSDGPGLPAAIPLPQTGVYIFRVSPNLMADGAFGPFVLTLTLAPAPRSGS